MAHYWLHNAAVTIVITDICNRCGKEHANPKEFEPGDAFQCVHCQGWSEVLSRFSDDGATCCMWFSPFDRTKSAPAPVESP